jgi:hypothetical protein
MKELRRMFQKLQSVERQLMRMHKRGELSVKGSDAWAEITCARLALRYELNYWDNI